MQDDEAYAKVENGYIVTDTSNINRFIAFKNPFRYRSYYYDFETNLYYLNSRYYDPLLGRFINADKIYLLNEMKDVFNGLNLYAYCGNNPVINIDASGEVWWNPFTWDWKKIGQAIAVTILTAVLVVGGVALTLVSGGFLGGLGATMVGAGIGGLIGGIQNQQNGGSFWGGYLGGAISGGLTALGASIGIPFLGGFVGNFAGTIVTDIIDGKNLNQISYWLNLTGESLFAGIINIGATKFGDIINTFNIPSFKDIFVGLTVLSEFTFSYLYDAGLELIKIIAGKLRNKFNFSY